MATRSRSSTSSAQPSLSPPKRTSRTRTTRRKPLGRPPRGPRSSERHKERARFAGHAVPHHITIRTVEAVRGLRQMDAYRAMRRALATTFGRSDFRIVHLSIQTNHIHLIVEADGHVALAKGMQGLQISAAQHLNRAVSRRRGVTRRGQVFADRYNATRIVGPRQARDTLCYVLNNWRRHDVDRRSAPSKLDPYSSALFFDGWRDHPRPLLLDRRLEPLPVALPHSDLLSSGWRDAGLIATDARPAAARTRYRKTEGRRR